jgi:hypothetical protein
LRSLDYFYDFIVMPRLVAQPVSLEAAGGRLASVTQVRHALGV